MSISGVDPLQSPQAHAMLSDLKAAMDSRSFDPDRDLQGALNLLLQANIRLAQALARVEYTLALSKNRPQLSPEGTVSVEGLGPVTTGHPLIDQDLDPFAIGWPETRS